MLARNVAACLPALARGATRSRHGTLRRSGATVRQGNGICGGRHHVSEAHDARAKAFFVPPPRKIGFKQKFVVELRGLEPLTPSMPWRCATSCATAPLPNRFRATRESYPTAVADAKSPRPP